MKLLRASVFLSVVALGPAGAWAQLGLYGSPEPLRLTTAEPAAPVSAQQVSYGTPVDPAYGTAIGAPQRPVYPVSAGAAPLPPLPPALPRSSAGPAPSPATVPNSLPQAVPGGGSMTDLSPAPANRSGCAGGADDNGCADLGTCGTRCCPWYASFSALVMSRDHANKLWTTYDANDAPHQIPTFPKDEWRWGGEVTVGRTFCCGCVPWSLELTYWGLEGSQSVSMPADVVPRYSTPLTMGLLGITNHAGSAADWFDNSPDHRVWRSSEFHDIELNLVRNRLLGCGECSPWNLDCSMGVRFFRFRDHFIFGAERGPGGPDAGEWIYLDDAVTNNLFGFQLGFNAEYRFARCWRAFVAPKIGIYDNYMDLDYDIHVGNDHGIQPDYAQQYPVHSHRHGFSVLGQIDAGIAWQFAPRWEAKIGYRLIAVSGAALAESQVPFYGNDTPAVADIDRNGDLILHGAFVGLTWTF
jgi:hypothetical protein